MSRVFPIILIIIATAGITYFVFQVLIPFLQIKSEYRDDQILEERLYGWGPSQTITLDFEAVQGNLDQNADVRRIEQNLQSCKYGFVDIMYPNYNRLMVAIDDESFEDDQCLMAMRAYAAKWESLDCNIPRTELAAWDGWKNRTSPDTSQIKGFCKIVSSFEGVTVEPVN